MADNSDMGKLMSCFASELNRIDNALLDMLTEMVPGLSTDLLGEWEQDLGLPESCFPPTLTEKERQDAAHTKYITKYTGLSSTFFVDLADSLGIAITITYGGGAGTPMRTGRIGGSQVNRVGPVPNPTPPPTYITDSPLWRVWSAARIHVWIVNYASSSPNAEVMQCLFLKFKPAHTTVYFNPT